MFFMLAVGQIFLKKFIFCLNLFNQNVTVRCYYYVILVIFNSFTRWLCGGIYSDVSFSRLWHHRSLIDPNKNWNNYSVCVFKQTKYRFNKVIIVLILQTINAVSH